MKVLVTGGAGFIGSNVVDGLIAAGHHVAVIDNLSTGRRANLNNPAAEFFEFDLRSRHCADAIRSFEPDIIDHHAAQIDVRRSVADPRFDAEVNVLGMLNVIEAGVASGVKKIVFSSSGGAIYGEQDVFPAPESHPCRPASPYGLTKRVGEMYLEWFSLMQRLPYVALRYANVYGPRQDPLGEAGVCAIFTGRMLAGQPITINGDGGQTRDFVYVGDVVRANLLALVSDFSGPVNIGTGVETSVNRVFEVLAKASGYPHKASHGPPKPGEQYRSVIDPSLAAKVLGWRPEADFETGVARTVEFFRKAAQSDRSD
ncbi:MAG: NAD-dependent epimerase/dehydratase family protein [Deltaproteobacteria bacterium]|nr:NAD-dependent epimerase/dehydratase family protein [Deltaproteobacteria bacterium]